MSMRSIYRTKIRLKTDKGRSLTLEELDAGAVLLGIVLSPSNETQVQISKKEACELGRMLTSFGSTGKLPHGDVEPGVTYEDSGIVAKEEG